jgi:hypothetical protein
VTFTILKNSYTKPALKSQPNILHLGGETLTLDGTDTHACNERSFSNYSTCNMFKLVAIYRMVSELPKPSGCSWVYLGSFQFQLQRMERGSAIHSIGIKRTAYIRKRAVKQQCLCSEQVESQAGRYFLDGDSRRMNIAAATLQCFFN